MRPKKSILVYCTDRELLSATAFALRLHPYEVTAVDDSRNAAALMMADCTELVCGVLIHTRQGDAAGRMMHRLLESDLHVPLLLVDRAGDLAPIRYADNWATRFPEMIDKVRAWERHVGRTFFAPCVPGMAINWIDDVVAWAKTVRGGRQNNLFRILPPPACESRYGLCE